MKKAIVFLGVWCLLCVFVSAQGTLQFNQVKIVTNNQETVPVGKVWKVTSIYGSEFCESCCINSTESFNYLGIKCNKYFTGGDYSIRTSYFITFFNVNGVRIVNQLTGMPGGNPTRWTSLTCSGGQESNTLFNIECANRDPNPNLMPMWVPAQTTLETGGPNTFLSVIEFNVIP